MAYEVLDVALEIINYAYRKENSVSNLKLQKILYFCQGYYLEATGTELFGEPIEAWPYGPVVPVVQEVFEKFGCGYIPYTEDVLVYDSEKNDYVIHMYNPNSIPSKTRIFIHLIIDKFDKYSSPDLSIMSRKTLPWEEAFAVGKGPVINTENIRKYFEKRHK